MNEVENGASAAATIRPATWKYATIRPRLTAVVGGRVEANGFFGTRAVPRVGASYALRYGSRFWGATRLRASYGKGIKEPALAGGLHAPSSPSKAPRSMPESIRFFASDRVHFRSPFFTMTFATSSASLSAAPTQLPRFRRQLLQYRQGPGLRREFVVRSEGHELAELRRELFL